MPNSKKEKTELDYGNGVVYILWNTTAPVYKVYIGSTARTLEERMAEHRNNSGCESRSIIESGTYDYEILEYFPCENKQQLEDREAYYILTNWDSCVNKMVPGAVRRAGGLKEYYKKRNNKPEHKEYKKQKIECNLCGSMSTRRHIAKHRKTKKCREAVQSQVKDVLNDMINQIS